MLAWLRQFLRGWQGIHKAFSEWRSNALAPQEEEKARTRRSRVRRWLDDLMLGRLPPDEQVRYFYRSTLESAAEQGIGRRPGETPHRFEARLANEVEDEDKAAISELTAGFVRVEFARQSAAVTAVPLLKRAWTQIRGALTRLRPDEEQQTD